MVTISAHLYDSSGGEIALTDFSSNITWSWAQSSDTSYMSLSSNPIGDKVVVLLNKTDEVPKDNYFILQAALNNWGDGYTLYSYLPIPIKKDSDYSYITGAKEVIYGSQGTPSYNKNVYGLYRTPTDEVSDVTWALNTTSDTQNYIHSLKKNGKGVAFSASAFYLEDENDKTCVYCYDEDGNVLWSQPILIM
jgi:hypothetical protein